MNTLLVLLGTFSPQPLARAQESREFCYSILNYNIVTVSSRKRISTKQTKKKETFRSKVEQFWNECGYSLDTGYAFQHSTSGHHGQWISHWRWLFEVHQLVFAISALLSLWCGLGLGIDWEAVVWCCILLATGESHQMGLCVPLVVQRRVFLDLLLFHFHIFTAGICNHLNVYT